ncbi:MAG: TrkA family potassium uptake protein, partial [Gordonia sp. (in: high G+C Gram-positive bacteria)]
PDDPIEGGDELVFIAPEEAENDLQQAMLSPI